MEPNSDRLTTLSNVQPFASSLSISQQWAGNSVSGFRTRGRVFSPSLDDPTLARRTTALRQFHGTSRPQQQRNHRQSASTGNRTSLSSQPVIVRTYSTGMEEASNTLSHRLGSGAAGDRPAARLPQAQEFGIESILQAIEPEIQDTLDTIAEICGRSKLSLANEYGSHRPPLGEIRAPIRAGDHGLLTVEEASLGSERLVVDENVIVVGDDISTVDGRDYYSSGYDVFEAMQYRNSGLTENRTSVPLSWAEANTAQNQAEPQRPVSRRESVATRELGNTVAAEHGHDRTRLPYLPWALHNKNNDNDSPQGLASTMITRPVVSEIHLEAEADRTHLPGVSDRQFPGGDFQHEEAGHIDNYQVDEHASEPQVDRFQILTELQSFLGWLGKISTSIGKQTETASIINAQDKLRLLLEQQDAHSMQSSEANRTIQTESS